MPKAFTLIELLVSITILMSITLALTVNFSTVNRDQSLRLDADNVVSLIRKAQVYSISGRQTNGAFPAGGYGLNFPLCATPPCKVILFADFDGSLNYNSAGNPFGTTPLAPSEEKIEELILGNWTKVTPSGTGVDLLFKPTQGWVCLYDRVTSACPPDTNPITINFTSTTTGPATKNIDVSTVSGQVTVR